MSRSPSFLAVLASQGIGAGLLDGLLWNAPFGVYVDDPVHGCTYANRALLDTMGLSWEAFRGFGWARAVHEDDVERLTAAIARYEHEGGTLDVRYRVRQPDGSVRAIFVRVSAITDPEGRMVGSLGITRDVTLEQQHDDGVLTRQKLQAMGELAGRIAHDVNNVLAAISASSWLIEAESEGEHQAHLQTIEQAVEQAAGITGQLMGLSKTQTLAGERVCLDDELRGLCDLIDRALGEQVELQRELHAGDAAVALAGHHLGQIVMNLALNARDAMPHGGTVVLASRREAHTAVVELRDTGTGIAPDLIAGIFDPFFTTKSAGTGTGLGLTSVREIVTRAGGEVRVSSVLGEGSRFEVALPLTELPASPPTRRPVSGGRPASVLLVDDNVALRQALAYALALAGHDVSTAGSVSGAEERLNERSYDVMISDVMLPDGSGAQLAEDLPIQVGLIFISGFTGEELNEVVRPYRVLMKPFAPRVLLDAVAELMNERAAPGAQAGS